MPIGKAPTSRQNRTESAGVWECENMQQEVIKMSVNMFMKHSAGYIQHGSLKESVHLKLK